MRLPRPIAAIFVPVTVLSLSLLSGCTTVSRVMSDGITTVISPYKLEIVQGNVITAELLAQVKPGRSRNEVRDVLGSPLLADPFHAQRWDYVFLLQRQGTEVQRRALVVWFEGDVVKSVDAQEVPTEREFVASISRSKAAPDRERKLELTPEERAALPTRKVAAKPVELGAPGAVRSYPPLEAP
jgi:outer membrane protein assembly factor BamE